MSFSNALADVDAAPKRALARRVRRTVAAASEGPALLQLTVPVAPADPLAWLDAQPFGEKGFWAGRGSATERAFAGMADLRCGPARDVLPALQAHLARQRVDDAARYFGGLRFDAENATESTWRPFASCRFVLPRFAFERRGDDAALACHLTFPRDAERLDEVLTQIERLRFPERTSGGSLPLPIDRDDAPDAAHWQGMMNDALGKLQAGALDKVVLARRTTFRFEDPLPPWRLLGNLKRATPRCFHFGFQPDDGAAFVGASPERLFRRDGRTLEGEAVAGTRPRSEDPAEDDRLRRELLASSKDRREHTFVQQHLRDTLGPLSRALDLSDAPSEMKLARSRHLRAGLRATLRPDVSTADLLAALHPTPAVGGTPHRRALALIRKLEPFDRGWYAGPVGWIGPEAADFAVAIRSGLVAEHRLALFSGAGLVEGSEAESEWDEIEQKISDFTGILGLTEKPAPGV
jgi:menaquinone-specific isochorismate synthase